MIIRETITKGRRLIMNISRQKAGFNQTAMYSMEILVAVCLAINLLSLNCAQASRSLQHFESVAVQDLANASLQSRPQQVEAINQDAIKSSPWTLPNVSSHNQTVNAQTSVLRRQLFKINKQPVKSIQSADGDIIDCVAKHKQPAFDHPLLKDHKFETFPSSFPTRLKSSSPPRHRIRRPIALPQTWHHHGRCPSGTIPVRRTSEDDLMRWAASSSAPTAYGKKTHKPPRTRSSSRANRAHAVDDPLASIYINGDGSGGHEHAIAYVEKDDVYGASAVVGVWTPWVETSNEFSLSQIWILGGTFDNDLNSIEAGWQVSPELYGDGRPRLFIYWTADGYEATGCYNLLCSGFVQTSDTVAIGAAISPVSRVGSSQYQIEIMIWKDPKQGNWWMAFEGSHIVGYWPAELFSHLSNYAANMVEWGGEVVNSRPNGRHTGTQMGSGHFADGGFGAASFFHSLQVVDSSNNLQPISDVRTLAENPHCYDIKSMQDPTWGTAFYFGGPGHNQLCL
ncbi:hypothetical protein L7F22_039629 [Adiantum nelumboides]|nr:hypothetical protein [Adiantum nelumboides]